MTDSRLRFTGMLALCCLFSLGWAAPAAGQTAFPGYGSAVSGNIDNTGSLSSCKCYSLLGPSTPLTSMSLSDSANGALSSSVTVANLASGVLSASAISGREGLYTHAVANSLVWDTLTFSGVTAGETAVIEMTGTASFNGSAVVSGGSALISASSLIGATPTSFLGALGGIAFSASPASYDYRNTVALANGPMVLFIGISASAGNSGAFNAPPDSASITDPYTLILPAGVSYTSAYQPVAAVPEPSTAALMLAGLIATAWVARRKRS